MMTMDDGEALKGSVGERDGDDQAAVVGTR
jgi:hypothetical protein